MLTEPQQQAALGIREEMHLNLSALSRSNSYYPSLQMVKLRPREMQPHPQGPRGMWGCLPGAHAGMGEPAAFLLGQQFMRALVMLCECWVCSLREEVDDDNSSRNVALVPEPSPLVRPCSGCELL